MEIEPLLARAKEAISDQLRAMPGSSEAKRWLVIATPEIETRAADVGEPHDLINAAISAGADGAVYASYVPGYSEQVMAYALVANPRNSDIRRSYVSRDDDGMASLGPWEYTV
jgi:hypothetical protein